MIAPNTDVCVHLFLPGEQRQLWAIKRLLAETPRRGILVH